MSSKKRCFFAADVVAAWPSEFPPGRILDENDRHLTLAFLGIAVVEPLLEREIPLPSFSLGLGGVMDRWIFLSSVVAAETAWISKHGDLLVYQKELIDWLELKQKPFLPHITVSRQPFEIEVWKNFPCNIPFYLSGISLQESLGFSHYQKIWNHPLISPFEEIEHTADIAFLIRGYDVQDLFLHAELALAFKFPPLLLYRQEKKISSLDQVIMALNDLISRADRHQGTPLKAVSFHDEISKSGNLLTWTMIVDV